MSAPPSSLKDLKMCQFSFRSPKKHPSQFFKDVILTILCQLTFRIVLLEDSYLDIGHSLLICPWAFLKV
jgi:hypothetical protein